MLNLTKYKATPDQLEAGLVDVSDETRATISLAMEVDKLRSSADLFLAADEIATVAVKLNAQEVLIGGSNALRWALESTLKQRGIKAYREVGTFCTNEEGITNNDILNKTIVYIVSINKMLINVVYAINVLSKNFDTNNIVTKLMSECDDAMLSHLTLNEVVDIQELTTSIVNETAEKRNSLIRKLTGLQNTLNRLCVMCALHHDITCVKYPDSDIIKKYNSTYPNAVSLLNIRQLRQHCETMLDTCQYIEYKNSFFTPKD